MNTSPSPELEGLVSEAVRGFMQTRRPAAAPVRAVRLPLAIRNDEDLAELLRWFRLLCASEVLRERFLSGAIELDPKLAAPASMPVAGNDAPAQPPADPPRCSVAMTLDEAVVTEAVLRRHRASGQVVRLKRSAVITPAARDYARTAGLRMERSE